MSYIVFARKYRPKTFDEVVGQSPITTTLKNAISKGRVAHAYIFAGPRGVGKTTTARILAKALNCEKGPAPEPCNSCATCNEITQGSSLDILEIDGASNRGIEEIRNLRESVKFAPSKGRFKVYIIDEVHMLTSEAFNALLKTLEEPPPHVKFVFATTQVHKVPPTILSRCQRFDFRRIASKGILENLKIIAKEENLNVNDEALALIAKYSDGSMRDGQVILDQLISFAQGEVTTDDVAKVLGIVDDEILFGLADSVSKKDAVSALKTIDALVSEGKDVLQIVLGLIEHFRNLSIIKISEDLSGLVNVGPDKLKSYEEQSQRFTIEEMLYIIYNLSNTIDFIRKSSLSRIPFETTMVKLTRPGSITSLTEIMERIDRLKSVSRQDVALDSDKPREAIEDKGPGRQEAPKQNSMDRIVEIDEMMSAWSSVVNYIRPKKISIASYLEEGYPVSIEDRILSVGFPNGLKFHKEVCEAPEAKRIVEEAIKEVLKVDLKVVFTLVEPVKIPNRNSKEDLKPATSEGVKEKDAAEESEPIIKLARDIFDGEVIKKDTKLGK